LLHFCCTSPIKEKVQRVFDSCNPDKVSIEIVQVLADVVSAAMGGDAHAEQFLPQFERDLKFALSRSTRGTGVLLLGSLLRLHGVCRHRSLLFKWCSDNIVLASAHNTLPLTDLYSCTLYRGTALSLRNNTLDKKKDGHREPHSWCVVGLNLLHSDKQEQFIVDLMRHSNEYVLPYAQSINAYAPF
jgi:hypothetical protein